MPARSVIAGLLVAVIGSVAAAGDGPRIDPRKAEDLFQLVRQDCGSCHGLTLKGGLGRPITPSALEHIDTDALRDIVLDGIPGTPMPPWSGMLTEEEADWIAYGLKKGRFQ